MKPNTVRNDNDPTYQIHNPTYVAARRERIMELVSFISIEDNPPDLILSLSI
jgi:hypothetical protein